MIEGDVMARRKQQPAHESVTGRNWIRAGDMVQVMSGDDSGSRKNPRRVKVLRVLPKKNKVVAEGVNKVFRHVRKSQEHPRGGRIEKEVPFFMSKVALVCPSCSAPSRRKIKVMEDGRKARICSACGAEIKLP